MSAEAVDFELIFEALLAPHLVLSPDLRIAAANEGLCHLLQLSRGELLGQPALTVFAQHPASELVSLPAWQEALAEVVRMPRSHTLSLQYNLRRSNGSLVPSYWQLQLRPVLTPHNTLRYLLCRVVNVTDEVLARQQDTLNREGFGLLAQATHDAIWDYDPRTDTVWRNAAFKTLFGFPPETDCQALNFWHERLHPADRPRVHAEQARALASPRETVFTIEYRFERGDGSWAEVVDRAYVLRDGQGQPVRLLGAMQDVTRQRAAERLAQQSATRFQLLAEVQHQLIWITDAEGHLEYVNPYWEHFTGLALPDSRDWQWQHLTHPDDFARIFEQRRGALLRPEPVEMEIRLLEQATGEYRWFLSRSVPVQAPDGTVTQWVGTATNIDSQKRTEQALQQSNEQFRHLLEALPQMAWMSRAEGGVIYYNQRWYDFTGGTFAELQEWGWEKFIHPDDLGPTTARWQHALATGTRFEAEHRWRNQQGQYRWFLARAEALRDADGHILHWVGTNTDIHERRQALQLLQEKDEQLQNIIGNVPAYIITMFGPTHVVGFINEQLQQLLAGRARVGQPVAESLPELAADGLLPLLDAVYASGQPYSALEVEFPILDAAGQPVATRYFDFTYQPLHDEDGRMQGILLFATDATERVQARRRADQLDAEVRRRDEQFRFLAESIPQIVWTARPDGRIDYYNQRWSDYTGFSPEESKQKGWTAVVFPEDREKVVTQYYASIRSGQDYQEESRWRGADGQYRWFLHRARPMRDAGGHVVKWFGTSTDIDDFKTVQQRLEQQNAALTHTNQDLDNFVYTASHDLKQPINNMAGIFEELTRTAYFRDPDAVKLIAMFERALHQIYDTIHNLSELVQVQKLRHNLPPETVLLEPLAREVLASIGEHLSSIRAEVTLDFTQVPVVEFVRPNLQSVLYNLLSNALKYAAPTRRPRILLRSELEEGHPVLVVQDNGVGIDLERYGSQLFTMFRRFHSHVDGSGMGLYLVNRIVQSHGGHVEVQSVVNEGTVFRIHLTSAAPLPASTAEPLLYSI
ncbi:PAS domain-containing sensor histidine kinase [Hymenobacter persicinus]|uniref:histidine kinase n=1 Tax=Hymenobacter persicinus TaxID=2025506 RepID=A0A4Q5LE51_9BACT|nr:PAS domain-containing protein [Hymenobacter persicinus]RYU80258.1 PAS domain S-box protein [Hymenobacter persicinus]